MAEARPKILKAAAALFATRGFHGTTTRTIAKKAAVNEGTIFKVFGSKRRLYRETLEWKLRELADRSLPAQPSTPHDLVKHVIEAREQDPYVMRLILFGVLEAFPEFKKVCTLEARLLRPPGRHHRATKRGGGCSRRCSLDARRGNAYRVGYLSLSLFRCVQNWRRHRDLSR